MKKILMGSIVLTVFAIALVMVEMSSCKKAVGQNTVIYDTVKVYIHDSVQYCPTATYPITGLWIGSYTVDGQPALGQQYFSFIIKPDGTVINDTKGSSVQHIALGTWTLTGNKLTCSFTCIYGLAPNIGIKETTTATWSNIGTLSGTWANVSSSGSGTITMTRVN